MGTQSFCDTLAIMKRSTNLLKLEEKSNCELFWNNILIKPLKGQRVKIKNNEFDVIPKIQKLFTITKLTAKSLDNNEEETLYDLLNSVGFYDNIPTRGLKSARMQDVIKVLPKIIEKIHNLHLPTTENVEDFYGEVSSYLEGQGIEKIIIPSNITDIYTRLEILLGIKLSGHTDTLTEASSLTEFLYKRGMQKERKYRNAPNELNTN